MASYHTSESLIESIKRRAMIPDAQVTFQNEDFLDFANEEMRIGLVPAILRFHEEFLVYEAEVPLEANKSKYAIPARALGSRMRDVLFKTSGGDIAEMTRIEPENRAFYQSTPQSAARAFYLENNNVVIVPGIGANVSGSLLITYYQRPNSLVLSTAMGYITDIDTVNSVLTLDKIPSSFSVGSEYDLVETGAAHKCLQINVVPTALNTSLRTITFASLPSDIKVGDQVTLASEANIPQVPDDLHGVLAQRVACRCLEAIGDNQNLQFAMAKLKEMEENMAALLDNRSEGTPQKATNLRSPLRQAKVFSLNRRRSY